MAASSITPATRSSSNATLDIEDAMQQGERKPDTPPPTSVDSRPVEPITSPGMHRSMLSSICIVGACTSSMVASIGLANPAIVLPSIGSDLGISQAELQWVINAYAISSACFLLLSGRLADLYGRKRVWIGGYIFLIAFGIGCGFAQDGPTLYVLRGFQGLGSAALVPASLGVLAHSFPPSNARTIAFATFSAGAPLGGAVAFMLGGVVAQLTETTWRTLFWILAGFSALGLVAGLLGIDKDEPCTETDRRVDWIGALLVTAGLILIIFVLSDSPSASKGWSTGYIIGMFVAGWILLILFAIWERFLEIRLDDPTKPRSVWTGPPLLRTSMWTRANGRFALMQLIACINWAAFTSWLVWVPTYYQDFLGLTPILAMIRILPITPAGLAANVCIALLIGRVDVQYIVTTGTLLTGVAVLLFAVIDPSASYWAYGFPSALIIVLGADFVFAAGTLFIAKITPPHEQSVAGAVFQAMTQIGTAIGVSISTIVFNSVTSGANGHSKEVQEKGYHDAMWTAFAFSMTCALLSLTLRGVGIVGHPPSKVLDQEFKQQASSEGTEAKDDSKLEKRDYHQRTEPTADSNRKSQDHAP